MAAALGALGNDGVGPSPLQMNGQRGGGHNGKDLDAGGLPGGYVLAGVARAGGDHGHAFLHHHLGHGIGLRVHEHDVHAEGFAGKSFGGADVAAQGFGVHAARADQPQGTGVGAGGGELAGGDVGHAALDEGKLGSQKFVQFHWLLLSAAGYRVNRAAAQVSPPPKPTHNSVWPGLRRPCSFISSSAMGMLAALVLP